MNPKLIIRAVIALLLLTACAVDSIAQTADAERIVVTNVQLIGRAAAPADSLTANSEVLAGLRRSTS